MEDEITTNDGQEIESGTPQNEEAQDNVAESGIDYKAELEKERKRREKAEFALYKKNTEGKRSAAPEWDEDELEAKIEEKIEARVSAIRSSQVGEIIDDELLASAKTDEERELVKFHYENSIVQSGSSRTAIREDLRKAKLLANSSKYERENAEMAETMKAKNALGNTSGGTNQARPAYSEDLSKKFTEYEWKFMQDRGWTEEMIKSTADAKKRSK